jgi:hypothetical protein
MTFRKQKDEQKFGKKWFSHSTEYYVSWDINQILKFKNH